MKVVILHHDLEWSEKQFLEAFQKKGVSVTLEDIRRVSLKKILANKPDLVMNRVYASVANRDKSFNFNELVKLISELEHKDIVVINSSKASKADYDKEYASLAMTAASVLNPKTYVLNSVEQTIELTENGLGMPFIRKPSLAGRGRGVIKVDNISQITEELIYNNGYPGKILAQQFANSILDFDYRVCVCGSEVLFTNTRTLIDGWLGSRSKGSKIQALKVIPKDIYTVAVAASRSINAYINSLDIVITEEGPSVIENNPTPNFNQQYIDTFGFNPINAIVERIIRDYS